MNIDKPTRGARIEGVLRAMLGFALLVAAAWAVAGGNGDPQGFEFGKGSLTSLAQRSV